jgi:bifunctional oligoribonuclease and PAP phosphatase NrnA
VAVEVRRTGFAALRDEDLASVPDQVVETIRGAKRVLAISHESPDADAFGSLLGVALAVELLGGTATAVSSDPPTAVYDFMPHIERVQTEPDDQLDYDLIVVSDAGDLPRVGRLARERADLFSSVPMLVIDNHSSNVGFGTVDWIDFDAAAACEMVALLVARLGIPLDALSGTIAADLMAGLIGDTAMFQHPNTTPRTLRVAAELLAAGAPMADVGRRIYRSKSNAQLHLFGLVLAKLQTALDGRLVWSTLEPPDLATAGASLDLSEGIIDLLAQSSTADVAILFRDMGDVTRISSRTRDGGVDATVLTGVFGGGGHARASGASVPAPLAQAIPLVLAEAERLVLQLDLDRGGDRAPGVVTG